MATKTKYGKKREESALKIKLVRGLFYTNLVRCARNQFDEIYSSVISQCILGLKLPALLWVVVGFFT